MPLDFFDDLGEAFLQHLGDAEPPEFLKEASWKEPFDLLDRDFALIMVDGVGGEHRKFACHDPGNTLMSMWYLTQCADQLPPAASKVACINLGAAALHQGIEKEACPPGFFELNTSVEDEWKNDILDEKRVKVAMAPGGMATQAQAQSQMAPGSMGQATGQAMNNARSPTGQQLPVQTKTTPRAAFQRKPGPGGMTRTASASSPFDVLNYAVNEWRDLGSYERHDIAVYLCKEGSACGVEVPDYIHKYGGTGVNPRFEALMQGRLRYVADDDLRADYERLGKMAAALDPEDVLEALCLLDDAASLTTKHGSAGVPDPVLCVFHQDKEAEYSWIEGGDMVTEEQLGLYAGSPHLLKSMGDVFTEDLCLKFKKSPLATFKGLPDEQKTILSRLASQSGFDNEGGAWR